MSLARYLNPKLVLLLLIVALILAVMIASGQHSLAASMVEYAL